jgi:hypothetical protein
MAGAMKRSVWILLIVLGAGALIVWLVLRPGSENVAYDFAGQFATAAERRPTPESFSITDATIGGETKRVIAATPPTRIGWDVTVPDNAHLLVSPGILEPGWTVPGDGVIFRVTVGDEELMNLTLDPYKNTADRHWQDLDLDLSEYAGEKVRLFLKTNASGPGRDDRNGDFAVWGHPRIVTR